MQNIHLPLLKYNSIDIFRFVPYPILVLKAVSDWFPAGKFSSNLSAFSELTRFFLLPLTLAFRFATKTRTYLLVCCLRCRPPQTALQ